MGIAKADSEIGVAVSGQPFISQSQVTMLPKQIETARPARMEVGLGVPAVRAHREAHAAGLGRNHGRQRRRRRHRRDSARRGRVGGHREDLHPPREIQVRSIRTVFQKSV